MKYTVLVASLSCALYGCQTVDMLRSEGSKAYDESLNASIRFACNDTSVGSIMRRFGSSKEAMQTWIDFCFGDAAVIDLPTEKPTYAEPLTSNGPAVPSEPTASTTPTAPVTDIETYRKTVTAPLQKDADGNYIFSVTPPPPTANIGQ